MIWMWGRGGDENERKKQKSCKKGLTLGKKSCKISPTFERGRPQNQVKTSEGRQ